MSGGSKTLGYVIPAFLALLLMLWVLANTTLLWSGVSAAILLALGWLLVVAQQRGR